MELGSDQTSCHAPFDGGYYPVQLGFEESNEVFKMHFQSLVGQVLQPLLLSFQMLAKEPERFKELVRQSLVRQVEAINKLADAGKYL